MKSKTLVFAVVLVILASSSLLCQSDVGGETGIIMDDIFISIGIIAIILFIIPVVYCTYTYLFKPKKR